MTTIEKIKNLESLIQEVRLKNPGLQSLGVLVRDIKLDIESMEKELTLLRAITSI